MLRHLGDLPRRLAQHCGAVYDYTPCPPVGYPELEGELWCHRYYLRHLADEARFPGWALEGRVALLQALLGAWRGELARRPLGLSEAEAARALGLDPEAEGGVQEDAMKAAYRRLARQFHPDRNPEGRERFEAVRRAYERLQAGAAGGQGPQPWRVLLLLRAQCILYRRHAAELARYKYAGYPLLLGALAPPAGAGAPHFLSPEVAPRLQAAAELCWLTCAASPRNGEELARSGGVALVGALLARCVAVVPADVGPTEPAAVLATQALRAVACMAEYPAARAELEAQGQVVADVLRAAGLARAPAATDAALQAAAQMAAAPALQGELLRRGALGHLIPLLLRYDPTLPPGAEAEAEAGAADGGGGGAPSARPDFALDLVPRSIQAARNRHARLAARALAALAGLEGAAPSTPARPDAQAALCALLTPALAPRLAAADPTPLLLDLNSTVATPEVIWNSGMRGELLAAAEAQRAAPDAAAAAAVSFEALRGEQAVAGVYVRVFNEKPACPLRDPAAFCKGLVTAIHQLQQPAAAGDGGAPGGGGEQDDDDDDVGQHARRRRRRHLLECLAALRALLEAAPRLLGLLATRPALDPLLSCLQPACEMGHAGPLWPGSPVMPAALSADAAPPKGAAAEAAEAAAADAAAAELALAALLRLTAHAGCVEALSGERCVLQTLWLAHRPPSAAALALALRLLRALAGSAAAAWAGAAHGGAVYLLSLLLPAAGVEGDADAEEAVAAARGAAAEGAAAVLARLAAHPLHGPRVAMLLGKLLPPGLVAAIQASAMHMDFPLMDCGALLGAGFWAEQRKRRAVRARALALIVCVAFLPQDGPPEAAVAALSHPSETPELMWTPAMRRAVAEEAAHLAGAARAAQAAAAATGALARRASFPRTAPTRAARVTSLLFFSYADHAFFGPYFLSVDCRGLDGVVAGRGVCASPPGPGGGGVCGRRVSSSVPQVPRPPAARPASLLGRTAGAVRRGGGRRRWRPRRRRPRRRRRRGRGVRRRRPRLQPAAGQRSRRGRRRLGGAAGGGRRRRDPAPPCAGRPRGDQAGLRRKVGARGGRQGARARHPAGGGRRHAAARPRG
jgi:DnaJ family protein C protein 13